MPLEDILEALCIHQFLSPVSFSLQNFISLASPTIDFATSRYSESVSGGLSEKVSPSLMNNFLATALEIVAVPEVPNTLFKVEQRASILYGTSFLGME